MISAYGTARFNGFLFFQSVLYVEFKFYQFLPHPVNQSPDSVDLDSVLSTSYVGVSICSYIQMSLSINSFRRFSPPPVSIVMKL